MQAVRQKQTYMWTCQRTINSYTEIADQVLTPAMPSRMPVMENIFGGVSEKWLSDLSHKTTKGIQQHIFQPENN